MIVLFLHFLARLCAVVLPSIFILNIAIGWIRSRAPLPAVFYRAFLLSVGVGIPNCAIVAAWLTWWIIHHEAAPD